VSVARGSARLPERGIGDELRPLLTPDDVAGILGVSRKQVLRLPLRRVHLGRRSPRYDPRDVVAFIERRKLGRAP